MKMKKDNELKSLATIGGKLKNYKDVDKLTKEDLESLKGD